MVNINCSISHNSSKDNNNNSNNNNGLINNKDEKVRQSVITRIMNKNSMIKQTNVQVEIVDKG
ncbi:unnamed protein product [Trichobilharzia regenti]|nr:unnamed protein product [Trichobilharzia regenti]